MNAELARKHQTRHRGQRHEIIDRETMQRKIAEMKWSILDNPSEDYQELSDGILRAYRESSTPVTR